MTLRSLAFPLCLLFFASAFVIDSAPAQLTTTLKATSDLFSRRAGNVVVSENGDFIVVASDGRVAKQIKANDLSLINELPVGDANAAFSTICMTQDRYVMVSRPYKKWATFSDLATGKSTNLKYAAKLYGMAFHPRLGVCFAGGNSTQIKQIAIPGLQKDRIDTKYSQIHAITFSPKGDVLAVGGHNDKASMSTIELRDDTGRSVVQTLGGINGHCCSLAFSESGKIVAASCYNGALRVWARGKQGLLFERGPSKDGRTHVLVQGERWVWIAQGEGVVQLLDLDAKTITVPNRAMMRANALCLLPGNMMVMGGGGMGKVTPLTLWSINDSARQGMAVAARDSASRVAKPRDKAGSGKSEPPTADQQAKARKLVVELLEIDPGKRLTSVEADRVSSMLAKAAEGEPDQANRYVALVEAARYATMAGNSDAAEKALAAIAKDWDVNDFAQIAAMLRASQSVNMTADTRMRWVEWARQVIDRAVQEQNFIQAVSVGNIAVDLANKARKGAVATDLKKRIALLQTKAHTQKKSVELRNRLRESPEDPGLNFELGVFLCNHEDWTRGFSHLAKSDDAACQVAAELELKSPASTADQLTVARRWVEARRDASTNPVKRLASASAAYWFDLAIKDLSGLTKLRAQKERDALGELTLKRTEH